MLADRLPLALDRGLLSLPDEGRIAVIGPRAGTDLSVLPKERVQVVTAHYPDHAYFRDSGLETATDITGPYSLAIVCIPRARDEARKWIATAAAATDGPVVVDGQKTDGIDALLKELRARSDLGEVLSKAHGKIAVAEAIDAPDWRQDGARVIDGRFRTLPGVFSADGVDPGSALLASRLPPSLSGSVVDLGAGWGYLSEMILAHAGVTGVDLVEADHVALSLARENVTDPRARFHWADGLTFQPAEPVDHVVTNPPFHTGRTPDASLGQGFIRNASRMLKPRGALWLVANRHLPYEGVLKDAFSEVRLLDDVSSYKLFHASKPRRPRKG
ncbi:methyltransferase [Alphaproteobacteria bacterium GH1-50]|uniref:Methyltransferase n=1 Tax=Kangsaoukella pontilimi TaxID=2691042 RepID=A0A7C9N2E1_9RHOB|nr:class I SAM-dependent methyltransferase [Kangsaoukella pontilimi]MXQ09318.1 methyltransferase [Kangsaoukella pontilimi]